MLDDKTRRFDYTKRGSVRFVFRVSGTSQGFIPRAFMDAIPHKDNLRSLVIYLEKDSLLPCFPDPDLENAIAVRTA